MANVALNGLRRGVLLGTDRAYAHGSKVRPERGGQGGRASDLIPSQRRPVTHGEFGAVRWVNKKLPSEEGTRFGGKVWRYTDVYIIDPHLDPSELPLKPQLTRAPRERVETPLRLRATTPGQTFVPSEDLVALYKRGLSLPKALQNSLKRRSMNSGVMI
jgi:hypothetical protein